MTARRYPRLCAAAGLVTALAAGCGSSQQYTALTVATDLPPGTPVVLQAQTDQIAYSTVGTSATDAHGSARFVHLLPGEYRVAQADASGKLIVASYPFGVGPNEAVYRFVTKPPSMGPTR